MKLIWSFLVAVLILKGSQALTEEQLVHLLELNQSFDILHKNFDFRINNALRNTSMELKILQAQMISRLGFVVDEIRETENRTLATINAVESIEGHDPECLEGLRESLQNAVEYVGSNIMISVGQAMSVINQVEATIFYPYIGILQRDSNIMQWMVLSELGRGNTVTNLNGIISTLEIDYVIVLALYQSAIQQIPAEMVRLHDHMDQVKESFFPELNSARDYFVFDANMIGNTAEICALAKKAQ